MLLLAPHSSTSTDDDQFEAWWDLFGCRTVGDPKDYARAAWRECERRAISADSATRLHQLQAENERLTAKLAALERANSEANLARLTSARLEAEDRATAMERALTQLAATFHDLNTCAQLRKLLTPRQKEAYAWLLAYRRENDEQSLAERLKSFQEEDWIELPSGGTFEMLVDATAEDHLSIFIAVLQHVK